MDKRSLSQHQPPPLCTSVSTVSSVVNRPSVLRRPNIWSRTLLLIVVTRFLAAAPSPGDRFAYLDERSPFYVSASFPKLTTPMWFGEAGVDAAIILSIDDMRDPEKYRAYLEPILRRLQEVEGGKSPLSIFTNTVDPAHPQLQKFLEMGVRFDVHTRTHPCPLLGSTLDKAIDETIGCTADLARIPGGAPAAFRMPCCDSINSSSPRFFSEILPRRTADGQFLRADSSVAMFLDEKDRAYAPFPNYAATAIGYPYPYVIGNLIWEFPIIVPTDWQAQHRRGPFHPDTVADMKANIDTIVEARGVYTLCFHPHGWIRNDQIVELIDHAVAKYGRRVRFVHFHEALDRIEKNLLGRIPLRDSYGGDNGVRLLDVDADGFIDVVIGKPSKGNKDAERGETRLWNPRTNRWRVIDFPFRIIDYGHGKHLLRTGVSFGVLQPSGRASACRLDDNWETSLAHFDGNKWVETSWVPLNKVTAAPKLPLRYAKPTLDRGARLRDVDRDGFSDILINNEIQNLAYRWDLSLGEFQPLPFALPRPGGILDSSRRDGGLRFWDIDLDGDLDVVLSNDDESYAYLFEGPTKGWSRRVFHGPAGGVGALPKIVSAGEDRGAWFQDGTMYVANEETAKRPDLVEIRRFDRIIEHMATRPLEPAEALAAFKAAEGFRVELVAAEPLVKDPVSVEFAPDGRVWVVEMGSYPLGEGPDSGGRVKFLRDTDGDGRLDQSTLFAGDLTFPTSALPWGPFDGRARALVACAPEILLFEDTDGDSRADRRTVVFKGFGEGNQQHRVNGLHWGLDNWIHGANGDSGGEITSFTSLFRFPTGSTLHLGRRDFRFSRDMQLFEGETGSTQHGLAFDDWGNVFGASNSRHLIHAVLPDRYLARNPHWAPGAAVLDIPDGAAEHGPMGRIFPISKRLLSLNAIHVPGHFSSACGLTVYRGEKFPREYQGNGFVCEPVGNVVHRDVLVPEGVTFRAERGEKEREFLASTDPWFRPVYAATGPDGALYIADMYRFVIEHPQYIPEEIQQILDFTAGRDRGRIWRVVYGRDPAGRGATLHPDLTSESAESLVKLIEHSNGWWRDTAQRLLVERGDKTVGPLLRKVAASNLSPPARLHALWTLEGLAELRAEDLERALADAHAGIREHALRLSEPFLEKDPALRSRAIALATDPEPRVRFQAAFTLGQIKEMEAAEGLVKILRQDIEDRWIRGAVLSSGLHHAGPMLGSLGPDLGRGRWLEALGGLVRTVEHSQGASTRVAGLAATMKRLREAALDVKEDLRTRVEAIRAVGGNGLLSTDPSETQTADSQGRTEQLARSLLTPSQPVDVQVAATTAIAQCSSPEAAPRAARILLDAWPTAGPSVRTEILEALLGRDVGRHALADDLEKGRIDPREIDAPARERLRGDPALSERAAKLFPRIVSEARSAVVERVRKELSGMKGNRERGKEVFKKNCATCHRLEGEGHDVGPDLAETRAKDEASLVEAILDPGRMVPPRYTPYVVLRKDGALSTGIVADETAAAVTLLRAGGVRETVLRADIRKLESSGTSLMPVELEKAIPSAELSDLLAFLRDQPKPLNSLTAAEMDSARAEVLRTGHNGLREVLRSAGREPQSSWIGRRDLHFVRQLDGKDELAWRTDPIPADLPSGVRHQLKLPAAMGYRSQPAGGFALHLGEKKLLDFDVSLESTVWKSPDGSVELRYDVRSRNEEDSTGLVTIDIPTAFHKPGEPTTLRVTGSPAGSRRWFGVISAR